MSGAAPTPEVKTNNATVSKSHTANETATSSQPAIRTQPCRSMQEQTMPTASATTGAQTTSKVKTRLVTVGAVVEHEDQYEQQQPYDADQTHLPLTPSRTV